MKELMF